MSKEFKEIPCPIPGAKAYGLGECTIFVARELGLFHLSISHPIRYPTWDEIHDARYQLLPDSICVAMLLPPKEEYVNLHSNCFHLWEIEDPRKNR